MIISDVVVVVVVVVTCLAAAAPWPLGIGALFFFPNMLLFFRCLTSPQATGHGSEIRLQTKTGYGDVLPVVCSLAAGVEIM